MKIAYIFPFGDGAEIEFDFRLGKDVGGCGHVDEEICRQAPCVSNFIASWLVFHLRTWSWPEPCSSGDKPCTVAFAPIAVTAPMDPTIKYWNTRLDISSLPLLYLLKSGTEVVSRIVPPLR